MSGLTTLVHTPIREPISELPRKSSSPVLRMPTEEPLILPAAGALLVAVEAPPLVASGTLIIAKQSDFLSTLTILGYPSNASAVAILPAEGVFNVVGIF